MGSSNSWRLFSPNSIVVTREEAITFFRPDPTSVSNSKPVSRGGLPRFKSSIERCLVEVGLIF